MTTYKIGNVSFNNMAIYRRALENLRKFAAPYDTLDCADITAINNLGSQANINNYMRSHFETQQKSQPKNTTQNIRRKTPVRRTENTNKINPFSEGSFNKELRPDTKAK